MIEVDRLGVSFGKRQVLHDMSFDVRNGEVVALVAGNGTGKTTCFRAIAGGLKPQSGRVIVDGEIQETGTRRIPVSYGSAERVTWPGRTARDVLRLMARLHGLTRRQADARIDELVAKLGMEKQVDFKSLAPSTGEAMKLTICRLLIAPARNVILDEPTAGLDSATVDAVRLEVEALRNGGHSVLISSHRHEDISTMADRVVTIMEGRAVSRPSLAAERIASMGAVA